MNLGAVHLLKYFGDYMSISEDVYVTICVWPDGTYCEKGDEQSYLQWMSDDFEYVEMSENEYDEFLRNN
jgi:hypothetical protein